jgi:hypothetical protein
MNKQVWNDEISRFSAMALEDKWRWHAALLFWITMLARDTYAVGGNSIEDPVRMRRFNELAHRVASQMQTVAKGTSGVPDDTFGKGVGIELADLHVDLEMLAKKLQHQ